MSSAATAGVDHEKQFHTTSLILSTFHNDKVDVPTLIWFNQNADTHETDIQHTKEKLLEINDHVLFFNSKDQCLDYIKSTINERVLLVMSGPASFDLLPEIYPLKQVDSIFIFCINAENYEPLLNEYSQKVIGIYTTRIQLTEAIEEVLRLLRQQLQAWLLFDEQKQKSTRNIGMESLAYLYQFHLKKKLILKFTTQNARQLMIDRCKDYYRGNEKELKNIQEFELTYRSDQAIIWYTRQCFIYKMVNKALRIQDLEALYIFRYFIRDLSRALRRRYNKQNLKAPLKLYRGLKLCQDEFQMLKQRQSISTNGFLSTSRSKEVAVKFASKMPSTPNPDHQTKHERCQIEPIMMEILVNTASCHTAVLADISDLSVYPQEQEVLFDLDSTFRIEKLIKETDAHYWTLKLCATNEGTKQVILNSFKRLLWD
ncbi:unnamed protein product [Didymodactylos carnosus]|uniref:ADP ribosyltransferase domain-containing protein n=1 Tax=Didymodactylos carnosus TaxID=1234261 RepID=A0A815CL94_9BILA|nr:unnamed protein product [Didymodactylos carnosus]CAF4084660.1 unnamed protein product [Didymodactylos carnosus]